VTKPYLTWLFTVFKITKWVEPLGPRGRVPPWPNVRISVLVSSSVDTGIFPCQLEQCYVAEQGERGVRTSSIVEAPDAVTAAGTTNMALENGLGTNSPMRDMPPPTR